MYLDIYIYIYIYVYILVDGIFSDMPAEVPCCRSKRETFERF
jgi:hypothetical protein